ncbi:MAG: DUF1223 domain-containing protein [Bacteroidota bacterium]
MKMLLSVFPLAAIMWLATLLVPQSTLPPTEKKGFATEAAPFAVVELFTSQGCSSCPPADRQLALLKKAAEQKGTEVYALSFHVDYWNYLGWKDPFSAEAFSQRQYQYSDWLRARVYTPQMVVNGQTEFIGSRRNEAEAAVAKALNQTPAYRITTTATQTDRMLKINYSTSAAPTGDFIIAALAQKEVKTAVKRGENHGKDLVHINVVRGFAQQPAAQEDAIEVLVPEDATSLSEYELIVFTQNPKTGEIKSATRVALGQKL